MEIIQERLQREYDLNLILTTPNVKYRVNKKDKTTIDIENPAQLPVLTKIDSIEEPYLEVTIFSPVGSMDKVMDLAKKKRGIFIQSDYVSDRMRIIFDMPLSEVIVDFNDMIKSVTRGYGSIDYKFKGFYKAEISKLDILINGKMCEAFSCLVNKERAYDKGVALVSKLKDLIPPQLYEVRLQAACAGRIISSAKVRAVGKNVTAKCYGGDITRKRKLWEKQKEGKKKLKQIGNVEIPQEAFLAVLKNPMKKNQENISLKREKIKIIVLEWVESIVIAFILAMFIRTFFIQAFRIPSGSMRMTLVEGDRLLVNKLQYGPKIPFTQKRIPGFSEPKRGDVIVFIYPEDSKRDFIKRLIAFGGETLEIRMGDIYINDKLIEDPAIKNKFYYNRGSYGTANKKIEVPEGSFYVLGDNSESSHDSRFWGFVPAENLIGKAEIIYWPPTRLRFIK